MPVDPNAAGSFIAELRKAKRLTQNELGERLNISFQAVSKWERGETLPDTSILPDLANVLETSIDNILSGGIRRLNFRGKITIADMREGIGHLEKFGKLVGRDSILYRAAINGINKSMNTDVEECFMDDHKREALIAEATVQNIIAGAYVDLSDVKNSFKHKHFAEIVCEYAAKHGIK